MLSVDEAIAAILARAQRLPRVVYPLAETLGLVLDEEIVADIDLPPFDKALMDGYAVRSEDFSSENPRRFHVLEEVTAGQTPRYAIEPGQATAIMTGAPLPLGADAVVMVERSRKLAGDLVELTGPVRPGMNRLTRGREMRAGEVLLARGTVVDAAKVGLIASAGRARVAVIPPPIVEVVSTGDELVDIERTPAPGQIRDTNAATLASLARAWGVAHVRQRSAVPDDPGQLLEALGEILLKRQADVLLISGGVSAGTRDLVPAALESLGVEPVFHKVRIRPGKPLWFGVGPKRAGDLPPTLVFGLPGNPASSVVGFLRFVRPALDRLAGRGDRSDLSTERLAATYQHQGDRPTCHPAVFENGRVRPLDWAGSADLRTVALADGFAVFPEGDASYQAGDAVSFLRFDRSSDLPSSLAAKM
jgi:molybdopterin molybdotransferase